MLTILGLLFLTVSGFVLYSISHYGGEGWGILGVVCGVFLLIILLVLGGVYLQVPGAIAKYEALKETMMTARNNPGITAYELAAIQVKVSEYNECVNTHRAYQGHILLGWFHPTKIARLEYLK